MKSFSKNLVYVKSFPEPKKSEYYFLRVAQLSDPTLFIYVLAGKMPLDEAEEILIKRKNRSEQLGEDIL